MDGRLRGAIGVVRDVIAAVGANQLTGDAAAGLVDLFTELERLANAGKTLTARRVEESRAWERLGYRTPGQWMAARTQTTLGAAIATLETAKQLDDLPATREALTAGVLSAAQAREIASAASADPSAELSLLEAAKTQSVAALRERCREVISIACTQDPYREERVYRSRYARHWMDADGAFRLDVRTTPDAGAQLWAEVESRAQRLRDQAIRVGSAERREAYAVDALVSLTRGTGGPRSVVHVHVDHPAWVRGWAERGESCRIPGVGPISVAAARRLSSDGIVKAVLREGADVRGVVHFRRTIPAKVRTALEARDQTCVVPDCDIREPLEIDHIIPLADDGPTRLDNLVRLCRYHHAKKTFGGWRLGGRPGEWRWFKPQHRRVSRTPGST